MSDTFKTAVFNYDFGVYADGKRIMKMNARPVPCTHEGAAVIVRLLRKSEPLELGGAYWAAEYEGMED